MSKKFHCYKITVLILLLNLSIIHKQKPADNLVYGFFASLFSQEERLRHKMIHDGIINFFAVSGMNG